MQNIVFSQPFIITGLVFLTAAGSFAGLAIKDRRPRESLDTPMVPTIPLMLIAGLVAMVAFVILLNLPRI